MDINLNWVYFSFSVPENKRQAEFCGRKLRTRKRLFYSFDWVKESTRGNFEVVETICGKDKALYLMSVNFPLLHDFISRKLRFHVQTLKRRKENFLNLSLGISKLVNQLSRWYHHHLQLEMSFLIRQTVVAVRKLIYNMQMNRNRSKSHSGIRQGLSSFSLL